ncbi:MAG: hypothetical protein C5B60_01830 [Chloroflexi bacterium]|nr:MAG: hypothetical protein C5B60_01830 [Chloroflexota bacterium]
MLLCALSPLLSTLARRGLQLLPVHSPGTSKLESARHSASLLPSPLPRTDRAAWSEVVRTRQSFVDGSGCLCKILHVQSHLDPYLCCPHFLIILLGGRAYVQPVPHISRWSLVTSSLRVPQERVSWLKIHAMVCMIDYLYCDT